MLLTLSCLIALVLGISSGAPSYASTKSSLILKDGNSCPKIKQVIVRNYYKFICVKKKSKLVWQSSPVFSTPDFQDTDVNAEIVADAPDGDIQYDVTWNGLDVNGLQFPDGTQADILIDGVPSGYQVDNSQSVSFYVSNDSHQVSLSVSGIENSDLISVEISEDSLDIPVADIPTPIPTGPPVLPASADPKLSCEGSGEISGQYPGWSSSSASKITSVALDTQGSYGIYWCPASNPSGKGKISYTITTDPGGGSCETIQTECVISNVAGNSTFYIMATDEVGSYKYSNPLIANSGFPEQCNNFSNWCNSTLSDGTYPAYGNVAPVSIGDCTFAAVANWEQIVLNREPDPTQIGLEFGKAGGTQTTGLTNDQVFIYWQNYGIAGVFLKTAQSYYVDPYDLENALDNPDIGVVIAQLRFTTGENFAGYFPGDGYHWLLVVGYTPTGPLVVTWGQTLQMTWQQWNYETMAMWGITTK